MITNSCSLFCLDDVVVEITAASLDFVFDFLSSRDVSISECPQIFADYVMHNWFYVDCDSTLFDDCVFPSSVVKYISLRSHSDV